MATGLFLVRADYGLERPDRRRLGAKVHVPLGPRDLSGPETISRSGLLEKNWMAKFKASNPKKLQEQIDAFKKNKAAYHALRGIAERIKEHPGGGKDLVLVELSADPGEIRIAKAFKDSGRLEDAKVRHVSFSVKGSSEKPLLAVWLYFAPGYQGSPYTLLTCKVVGEDGKLLLEDLP